MPFRAYQFVPKPGGGFHLGREGLEQEVSAEIFPSDSLFAALVAKLVETQGTAMTEQLLAAWPRDGMILSPPFRLSSVFPYVGQIPLFPMPRLHVLLQEGRVLRGKTLKRLAFVSPTILELLLVGAVMDDWLPETLSQENRGILLQEGRVWIAAAELDLLPDGLRTIRDPERRAEEKLWSTAPVPRVTLDRQNNSSVIYYVGRTVFMEDCGLWLLADIERNATLLEELLYHLADAGIGGDRSAGYGAFTLQEMAAPGMPSADGPRVMTLSRYSPTFEELQTGVLGEGAAYELVDVGGWLATPGGAAQRRKRVRFIEAGSILAGGTNIIGQLVDVRPDYPTEGAPDHPVYRSGVALTVGVNGGQ